MTASILNTHDLSEAMLKPGLLSRTGDQCEGQECGKGGRRGVGARKAQGDGEARETGKFINPKRRGGETAPGKEERRTFGERMVAKCGAERRRPWGPA